MKDRIPSFLLSPCDPTVPAGGNRFSRSILDRSLRHIGTVMRTTLIQWELSSRNGVLQGTDARVKLLGLLFLLVVASLKKELLPELYLAGLLCLLALLSRVKLAGFYRSICLLAFLFGFLVIAPAALNIFTAGTIIFPLVAFKKSYTIWTYTIPQTIGVTREGCAVVALITTRIINSLSICFLLLYTTPLTELIRALKVFRVPDTLLMVFILTYKYVVIFSMTLEDIYLAKKSRLVWLTERRRTGDWVAGRMAFFLRKTRLKCEEVFNAMISRGATKEIKLQNGPRVTARDLSMGLCLVGAALILLWI